MQRMVAKYLTAKESKSVQKLSKDSSLPVYGFKNEAKDFMSKTVQKILSILFGVAFIVVMLVLSIRVPEPTHFQYTVFRTVIALAGAGCAATFPGFIEVELGKWLRAGGALAVFPFFIS